MKSSLKELGFSEQQVREAALYIDQGLYPGRVTAQYRDYYKVATLNGEVMAEVSGKLHRSSVSRYDFPAVGDLVMIDREDDRSGKAIIHQLLTRKSVFIRRAAGTGHEVQVVAANIDTVFLCMSLYRDFNLRRLERYLSIAWDSGAVPVIILTKADLCNDIAARLAEVNEVAPGVDVVVTTVIGGEDGYASVRKYITAGKTVAFLGSSGVGKSTLINRLLGEEIIKTGEIRKDGKGKHITTRRELFVLPSGGAVIDTPGMRELGVESVDLAKAFTDIEELAGYCKFNNCRHEKEPGCAVRKAVADGLLTEERLLNYRKIQKEAGYDGLNSKQIERKKMDEMYSSFGGIKNARDYVKSKKKR